jgi:hypothetical protein
MPSLDESQYVAANEVMIEMCDEEAARRSISGLRQVSRGRNDGPPAVVATITVVLDWSG